MRNLEIPHCGRETASSELNHKSPTKEVERTEKRRIKPFLARRMCESRKHIKRNSNFSYGTGKSLLVVVARCNHLLRRAHVACDAAHIDMRRQTGLHIGACIHLDWLIGGLVLWAIFDIVERIAFFLYLFFGRCMAVWVGLVSAAVLSQVVRTGEGLVAKSAEVWSLLRVGADVALEVF